MSVTTDVFGLTLTYGYDGRGHVTSRQDSKNGLLTSTYDDAGRLSSRQFGGSGQTPVRIDFGYTVRGEQSSVRWFSDLAGATMVAQSLFGYDDAGNTTSVTTKDGRGATLSYYNYTFDSVNRVTSETHSSAVGTTTYSGTRTFTYDPTSQLTSDGTTTYTYDGNGNRTMAGYQTGAANRLSNDGTFTYTYDDEGNLVQKSKGSGLETWYYSWDQRNRLTSVRKTSDGSTNQVVVSYSYDALDRRVKQQKWTQASGTTTEERYAYDGQNIWADLDSGNNVTVRRIYGDGVDQLLSRTVVSGANAGVWAYATDRLGSVRDLIDWSGAVRDHLDYDGFGNLTESNASVGDRYAFTGRELDKDTGEQYHRAREYSPGIGRWDSEDPLRFDAGDGNLYRYARNDATNALDPTGEVAPPAFGEFFPSPFLNTNGIVGNWTILSVGPRFVKSNYGGGKISVPEGPVGELDAAIIDYQHVVDGKKALGTDSMAIAYRGTKADYTYLKFVQFFWVEARLYEERDGKPVGEGSLFYVDDSFNATSGVVYLSKDTKTPTVTLDVNRSGVQAPTDADCTASFGGGETKAMDALMLLDQPTLSRIAWSLAKAYPDKVKGKVLKVTAHYSTYLVYKRDPIYKIKWDARSQVINGKIPADINALPITIAVVGGGKSPADLELTRSEKELLRDENRRIGFDVIFNPKYYAK